MLWRLCRAQGREMWVTSEIPFADRTAFHWRSYSMHDCHFGEHAMRNTVRNRSFSAALLITTAGLGPARRIHYRFPWERYERWMSV